MLLGSGPKSRNGQRSFAQRASGRSEINCQRLITVKQGGGRSSNSRTSHLTGAPGEIRTPDPQNSKSDASTELSSIISHTPIHPPITLPSICSRPFVCRRSASSRLCQARITASASSVEVPSRLLDVLLALDHDRAAAQPSRSARRAARRAACPAAARCPSPSPGRAPRGTVHHISVRLLRKVSCPSRLRSGEARREHHRLDPDALRHQMVARRAAPAAGEVDVHLRAVAHRARPPARRPPGRWWCRCRGA